TTLNSRASPGLLYTAAAWRSPRRGHWPISIEARLGFGPRTANPLLVLDGIGNPHNLGALARSAAFFGLERMVLADRPDQALPSDASYRVAEGGLEHLDLQRAPFPAALFEMRPAYRVIGTALGHGPAPDRLESGPPVALVFGN